MKEKEFLLTFACFILETYYKFLEKFDNVMDHVGKYS
jgi:hypothetical protein